MTKKLTPKQEAFANKYVETSNASEAYRHAYDAENTKQEVIWKEASVLLANRKVSVRVFELQERLAKRTLVTAESITKELEEARLNAQRLEQTGSEVSAAMGKAKVNGLLVDKVAVDGTVNVHISNKDAQL